MKKAAIIGAGRISRIILEGLKRKNEMFEGVNVFDINQQAAQSIKEIVPSAEVFKSAKEAASGADIVILAVHPPVFAETANELSGVLKSDTVLLSLVPKIRISKTIESFGGLQNVARMNPNAPSIVNAGYNPISFSEGFDSAKKIELIKKLSVLGNMPEVKDDLIEAYAVITAMGYTYLDYQLAELFDLAKEFGISENEARDAIQKLAEGTAKGVTAENRVQYDFLNLVPVRPLSGIEENVKNEYREKLRERFKMLTN
ncbi:MAG: NAD(P)-binding domain-containing protein [Spirochaetes bacterium]|nr:NAD(P)-binding domain-containing protein [Spirochaetota bacterium]